MNRSFHKVRPSAHRVYSVKEVRELYGICRNTLSNWVKRGLTPSDNRRPQVFRGAELKRFHFKHSQVAKRHLRQGEFRCLRCRCPVFPRMTDLKQLHLASGRIRGKALCPDCRVPISKLLGATESDRLKESGNPTTQLDSEDEF